MTTDEFKSACQELVQWAIEYYEHIEEFPVKATVKPQEIIAKLQKEPPVQSENFKETFQTFVDVLMPGLTHWQHPAFFAYFNANSSLPSVLGEFITAVLGVQGMSWETSPAATELEEVVIKWLLDLFELPKNWWGCIVDTASVSTLNAIIAAREKMTDGDFNRSGSNGRTLRVYCSDQTHNSVDKAVRIAGIGSNNLVKINTDAQFSLIPSQLENAFINDIEKGYIPTCVVATCGSTGVHAFDPISEIAAICHKYNVWLHVDAAHAGPVMALSENRHLFEGIEMADSVVINPHKWMFVNFDCSILFVRNKMDLYNAFSLIPEYLRTDVDDQVTNYKDYGIQLGRRFRALKLWMVLKSFGTEGIRQRFRHHLSLAAFFSKEIEKLNWIKIVAPTPLNLICFRIEPPELSAEKMNDLNQQLLLYLNNTGKVYLSGNKIDNNFMIRVCIGQTYTEQKHVELLIGLIKNFINKLDLKTIK